MQADNRFTDLINTISKILYPPESAYESDVRRINRAILVVMATATSLGGIIWGITYLLLGVPEVSIYPFGYVVFSALNLVLYLRTRQYRVLLIGQVSLILIVPTVLQWAIGGYAASGAVILWAFLSPIVALVVSDKRKHARVWFILFFGLVFISGIMESQLQASDVGMPSYGKNAFFVMNLFAPLITSYVIVYYFIGEGRRAQAAMAEQTKELAEANTALQELTESLEDKVKVATLELRDALSNLSQLSIAWSMVLW